MRLESAPAREARAYRDDFFREMRDADRERRAAVAWSGWAGVSSETGARKWMPWAIAALLLGGPLTSGVMLLAAAIPVPPALRDVMQGLGSLCGMVVVMGGFGVYVTWLARASGPSRVSRRGAPTGASREVACPHCGAPNRMSVGQALETCTHCRGALVPSRTMIQHGLDAARAARRQAALARYAAERRGAVVAHHARGQTRYMLMAIVAFSVGPMVLGLAVMPFFAGGLAEAACALGGLLMLAGPLLAGGLWWYTKHRRRQTEWRSTLADLAAQFAGRTSRRPADFVGWLEQNWAAPYDARFIAGDSRWAGVFGHAWGYRVAMVLNPYPPSGYSISPSYTRILLAAWVPSVSDGGPPPAVRPDAQRTLDWLRAAGFHVSCEEGGILAMAKESVVAALKDHPGSAHQLAPIVGHLARLAHEIGAVPT